MKSLGLHSELFVIQKKNRIAGCPQILILLASTSLLFISGGWGKCMLGSQFQNILYLTLSEVLTSGTIKYQSLPRLLPDLPFVLQLLWLL